MSADPRSGGSASRETGPSAGDGAPATEDRAGSEARSGEAGLIDSEVKNTIRRYVATTFLSGDGTAVSDETDLKESRILDSFATLDVIQFLEDTFGVRIEPERIQADTFRSINSIADLVTRVLAEEGASSDR